VFVFFSTKRNESGMRNIYPHIVIQNIWDMRKVSWGENSLFKIIYLKKKHFRPSGLPGVGPHCCPPFVRPSVRPSVPTVAGRPAGRPSIPPSVCPGSPASVTASPRPLRRPLRRLGFCVKVLFFCACFVLAGRWWRGCWSLGEEEVGEEEEEEEAGDL
jgi:hypothetical protein